MSLLFPVSPAKQKALLDRMASLGINESDIEEVFVRSAGKGGQHVNKTSTCVQLRHIPTGIEVRCQRERSQSLNRYHARVMLADKIELILKGSDSKVARQQQRIKKQKQRRKKRAVAKYIDRTEKERVESIQIETSV